MFPVHEFEARFGEILEQLDAAAERAEDETAEALEELNAEFEDALMLLWETDMNAADWREELEGALEEFDALCADYQKLGKSDASIAELAGRLSMLLRVAEGNLSDM